MGPLALKRRSKLYLKYKLKLINLALLVLAAYLWKLNRALITVRNKISYSKTMFNQEYLDFGINFHFLLQAPIPCTGRVPLKIEQSTNYCSEQNQQMCQKRLGWAMTDVQFWRIVISTTPVCVCVRVCTSTYSEFMKISVSRYLWFQMASF